MLQRIGLRAKIDICILRRVSFLTCAAGGEKQQNYQWS
jgi:hypothetical protein